MEDQCNKSAKGMNLAPSSSSSSSSCFITDLPTPILTETLCRLPLKTLAACKCVCKSWLNLSKDPEFTQLHQAKAPTEVFLQLYNDKDTLKLHIGNFHLDPFDVKLNTLFEIPKFSVEPNNTLDYKTVTGDFNFSNSCNGLLCYHGGDGNKFVVVWNPCTSEFITLPALKNCCGFGLGFSRKANKYKLLRVVSQFSITAETCTIEKGCSWKSLGPCPSDVSVAFARCSSPYYFRMQGTFLHGTLHWLSNSSESDIHILTFDFEDDRFGRVPLPSSFGKQKLNTLVLCRVGELLGCLFITEYTNEGVNIWLMKEYGVEDSWTKMYYLPCNEEGRRKTEYRLEPVTCMDNGEILLVDCKHESNVFSYNPYLKGFRFIGSCRRPLRVMAYRPSLVPLKDSMLGFEVHVTALKHREMSESPVWWTLLTKCEKRKEHVRANVSAMMEYATERIDTMRKEAMEKQRKEQHAQRMRKEFLKVVEPLEEQIEQFKLRNRQLEERLQNEKAKVKQLEEKLQQSEQLMEESRQMMDEMRARFTGSH